MKTAQSNNEVHESTYALLVRSEEKERGALEAIAYGLVILSAVAAIWQFAQQPLNLPLLNATSRSASVLACDVAAHC